MWKLNILVIETRFSSFEEAYRSLHEQVTEMPMNKRLLEKSVWITSPDGIIYDFYEARDHATIMGLYKNGTLRKSLSETHSIIRALRNTV